MVSKSVLNGDQLNRYEFLTFKRSYKIMNDYMKDYMNQVENKLKILTLKVDDLIAEKNTKK
jgi:hypothetical protein